VTDDEAKDRFFKFLFDRIQMWKDELQGRRTVEEILEGFAFSLCSGFDGCAEDSHFEITAFDLDDDFEIVNEVQVSGNLHEEFHDRLEAYKAEQWN
jgi:hypothetical protein